MDYQALMDVMIVLATLIASIGVIEMVRAAYDNYFY